MRLMEGMSDIGLTPEGKGQGKKGSRDEIDWMNE
jgi:hypothetical protein